MSDLDKMPCGLMQDQRQVPRVFWIMRECCTLAFVLLVMSICGYMFRHVFACILG